MACFERNGRIYCLDPISLLPPPRRGEEAPKSPTGVDPSTAFSNDELLSGMSDTSASNGLVPTTTDSDSSEGEQLIAVDNPNDYYVYSSSGVSDDAFDTSAEFSSDSTALTEDVATTDLNSGSTFL